MKNIQKRTYLRPQLQVIWLEDQGQLLANTGGSSTLNGYETILEDDPNGWH
jgi:hypothetical protein